MALHPVLAEKLSVALAPAAASTAIRREARLPAVPGKVHAAIGLRRTGKSTYLRQLVVEYDRRYSEWRGTETVHWFLDEIQFVPEWERQVAEHLLRGWMPPRCGGRRSASTRPLEGLEAGDCIGVLALHGMPQIPVELEPQPEVRRHPENSLETKRSVGSHSPLPAGDLVEAGKGNAEAYRECGLAYPQGPEELLQEHLTGMGGRPMRRQAPPACGGAHANGDR